MTEITHEAVIEQLTLERMEKFLLDHPNLEFTRCDGAQCPVYALARHELGEDVQYVRSDHVEIKRPQYIHDYPLPALMQEFITRFDNLVTHGQPSVNHALAIVQQMKKEQDAHAV